MLEDLLSGVRGFARSRPDATAFIFPDSTLSFRELEDGSSRVARALLARGIRGGDRVVLLVPPGPDFFLISLALLKIQAVLVLIDPGIGWANLSRCLDEAEPRAFIGVAKAHVGRLFFGWAKRTLEISLLVGWPARWSRGDGPVKVFPPVDPDRAAAIAFTSGSTGVPKGVIYTHRLFAAQMRLMRETLGVGPGDVNIATFAPFAFLDPGLGITSVLPRMDFRRPGKVNAAGLLALIARTGARNLFGSPALLRRLADHVEAQDLRIPSLNKIYSAGAPVPPRLLETLKWRLPADAQVFTPYGATEALPLTNISATEILGETRARSAQGAGVCVGRPVGGVRLVIMKLGNDPAPAWRADLAAAPGEVGEIVAFGENVSRAYHGRPEADALHKIRDGDETGHRTGDTGYFDDQGRLWFCGRKTQIVWTAAGPLHSVAVEEIFNVDARVLRTALVGVDGEPALCVELAGSFPEDEVARDLRLLALPHENLRGLRKILFHPGFPVDIRHNAKINREKLSAWARSKMS